MLHRNARRDFSVEIKSAGRRGADLIPTRAPKPARTRFDPLVRPEAEAPPAELPRVAPAPTGRVLQSLIVEEPPQPAIEATAPAPKTRRPYIRRAKPAPVEVVDAPSPKVERPQPPVQAPVAAPLARAPSKRSAGAGRGADVQQLGLGQRWKRRLSRWSR